MDEGAGLDILIDQRKKRPLYARMVSWEFSRQPDETCIKTVKEKRKRSKGQSDVGAGSGKESSDENVTPSPSIQSDELSYTMNHDAESLRNQVFTSSSDDDCLYVSAEEEISSAVSEPDASELFMSLNISSNSDLEDLKDSQTEDCIKGSEEIHFHKEKHRAPSKKQKRKKRRRNQTIHCDIILPFLNMDVTPDVTMETKELMEDSQTSIEKNVPSLVELCLNCVRQTKTRTSLPVGLKAVIQHSNYDLTFRQFQVSWLQNVFSEWQPFAKMIYKLYHDTVVKMNCWEEGEPIYKALLPTRNIWNTGFYPKFANDTNTTYSHSKTSSILPYTYATRTDVFENAALGYRYVFNQRFLGALATLVDLMMPTVLSKNISSTRQTSQESESDQLLAAMKTAMIRVKGALRLRFTDVIDQFFHKVIPYVFWARGDVQYASSLFTHLIDGDTRSRYRAMCMVEIARMHSMFEDSEKACKFYRMASDIATEKGKASNHSQEVTGQMLMLLANVYDQGMMTPDKIRSGVEHWKYVVSSPHVFNQGAANMAAISLLCFHSRPKSENGPSSFEDAKVRLQSLVDVCPKYLYHLSMLQALDGRGSDAGITYKEFSQKGDDPDTPGLGIISNMQQNRNISRNQRQNVWHSLAAMVTKCGPPEPLHVLWRVQLQPLRVCGPSNIVLPTEADLCCHNLDLRLNSQGYLTGNMKMMLPPIRSINLDPYTGKLCFPQTPLRNEPWTSVDSVINDNRPIDNRIIDIGFIPTPVQVYQHEDGTNVQMMMPTPLLEDYYDGRRKTSVQTMLTFFWSDGKGQSAKLNIMNKIRHLQYEMVKKQILRKAIKSKQSSEWQKSCLRLLKHCYDQKHQMDFQWIDSTVSYCIRQNEDSSAGSQKKKIKSLTSSEMTYLRGYFRIQQYTLFGKTLVFHCDYCSTCLSFYIDCSSRDGFLDSKIVLQDSRDPWNLSAQNIANRKNNTVPGANIYCYSIAENYTYNDIKLIVCGERGEVIGEIRNKDVTDEVTNPYVVGHSVLMINKDKRLWCWNDNNTTVKEDLSGVTNIYPLEISVVMVKCSDTLRFVDTPSLEVVPVKLMINLNGLIEVSDDGWEISTRFSVVKVLMSRNGASDNVSYREVVLGLDTYLVTLRIMKDINRYGEVQLMECVPISGFPVEMCFVGEKGGYLLSWTQHSETATSYKEHISYFNRDSKLQAVLPFLGKGPRCFYPVYLPGDTNTQTDHPGYGQSGWYVYMRDGHDGILGVKLPIY